MSSDLMQEKNHLFYVNYKGAVFYVIANNVVIADTVRRGVPAKTGAFLRNIATSKVVFCTKDFLEQKIQKDDGSLISRFEVTEIKPEDLSKVFNRAYHVDTGKQVSIVNEHAAKTLEQLEKKEKVQNGQSPIKVGKMTMQLGKKP